MALGTMEGKDMTFNAQDVRGGPSDPWRGFRWSAGRRVPVSCVSRFV